MKPWEEVTDERAVPAMRRWRERGKRTQSDAAEAMGVHRSTYNLVENGRQPLTYRHLKTLAEWYGVDEETFLSAADDYTPVAKPAVEQAALRGMVYAELGRVAAAGATESQLADAKLLLLSPMVVGFLANANDAAVQQALRGVVDALILPSVTAAE